MPNLQKLWEYYFIPEAVAQGCSGKKVFLEILFSCEFCEISKDTFSCRTPPVAASDICLFGQTTKQPLRNFEP